MNDREFINLLEQSKNAQELGGGFDIERLWDRFAAQNNFPVSGEPVRFGVRDYLEFYLWETTRAMARPLAAGFAVFAFLLTGWVGVGNASLGSLPGQKLYPAKLAFERVQLSLAFAPEQKAKLQVEFTSRRLEEMVELSATSYKQNPESVRLALHQFKKEVQTLREDLKVEAKAEVKTQLAREIGRKSGSYKASVANTSAYIPEAVKEEVDEVQALLEETEDEAVEVIITAHEAVEDEATAFELEAAFEKELVSVRARGLNEEQKKMVEQAIELKEQGWYRRAFQVLRELAE
ncbi:hypothetical protein FJZ23_01930 [Candidatus Parcubacteria bacterium]|nr:hypothetical protein [Candidatus Parcubacteria bacterium]